MGEEHEVLRSIYFASHIHAQWETMRLNTMKARSHAPVPPGAQTTMPGPWVNGSPLKRDGIEAIHKL